MARLKALDKAFLLVKNENVFNSSETPNYEYWIVKGNGRPTYDVIYHKRKDIYTCGCKNMRLLPCSHILAVKIVKGEINGKNNKTYKRNSLELVL